MEKSSILRDCLCALLIIMAKLNLTKKWSYLDWKSAQIMSYLGISTVFFLFTLVNQVSLQNFESLRFLRSIRGSQIFGWSLLEETLGSLRMWMKGEFWTVFIVSGSVSLDICSQSFLAIKLLVIYFHHCLEQKCLTHRVAHSGFRSLFYIYNSWKNQVESREF